MTEKGTRSLEELIKAQTKFMEFAAVLDADRRRLQDKLALIRGSNDVVNQLIGGMSREEYLEIKRRLLESTTTSQSNGVVNHPNRDTK